MTVTARPRLRRALVVPASMVIVAGALATSAGLLSPQRAAAVSCPTLANPQTYTTAGEFCFTVPAGVTSIHAVLIGAAGGAGVAGTDGDLPGAAGAGGHGMDVSGNVVVTPGEIIWVYVGGNGHDGATDSFSGGAGGFNGGAQGGGNNQDAVWAGGGGGATDLRTSEATTPFTNCGGDFGSADNFAAGAGASFLLVAAGGGGGGNGANSVTVPLAKTQVPISPDGGNGGSQPADTSPPSGGTQGSPTGPAGGGGGGGAGTSSAGGAAGVSDDSPTDDGTQGDQTVTANDTRGCGGTGGAARDGQTFGGGGGGGYHGGGGGGGGSSFCPSGASRIITACINTSKVQTSVVLTTGFGGGGGGGSGSDFHSSAVTGYAESIDAPGASATITYTLTPTASVAPLTVPPTGGGGPTLNVGVWLLGIGLFLLGSLAVARRRGEPRSPA
jgi:hypothetical protein